MVKTAYRYTWLCVTLAIVTAFLVLHPPGAQAADDTTLWEDACAKIDAGELAGATVLLNQLLEEYPDSPKAPAAQLKLAYVKIKTNPESTAEIVDAFSLVRTKYPASGEAAEALARIGYLHCRSDKARAVSDFAGFLLSYPKHRLAPHVEQSLARLYLRQGELDRAEQAFDNVKDTPGISAALADEAALQSGFVKIMKFYKSKDKSHLTAAIDALGKLGSSSRMNVRARADLGVAEATLLLRNREEAHAKYAAAAETYSGQPYFRGIALYGTAFSSQEAGKLDQAIDEYNAFLAAQSGSTLAEKDAAWKSVALASTSRRVQISIEKAGNWRRLPGIEIVRRAVCNQARCLYLWRRYDEAIPLLAELVECIPKGTEVRAEATRLLARCRNAKGGSPR